MRSLFVLGSLLLLLSSCSNLENVSLAILAFSTGQLPRILKIVRTAQLEIIKDSQASKWPRALTLPRR
jgi:hypothetical protein